MKEEVSQLIRDCSLFIEQSDADKAQKALETLKLVAPEHSQIPSFEKAVQRLGRPRWEIRSEAPPNDSMEFDLWTEQPAESQKKKTQSLPVEPLQEENYSLELPISAMENNEWNNIANNPNLSLILDAPNLSSAPIQKMDGNLQNSSVFRISSNEPSLFSFDDLSLEEEAEASRDSLDNFFNEEQEEGFVGEEDFSENLSKSDYSLASNPIPSSESNPIFEDDPLASAQTNQELPQISSKDAHFSTRNSLELNPIFESLDSSSTLLEPIIKTPTPSPNLLQSIESIQQAKNTLHEESIPPLHLESNDLEIFELIRGHLRLNRPKDARNEGLLLSAKGLISPEWKELLLQIKQVELTQLEMKLKDYNMIPKLNKPLEDLISLKLDNRSGFLLSQMDGRTTLSQILMICGFEKLEFLQLVDELVSLNVISF